ncbi:MAG: polymer-forming cytoskeletal protein [Hyphomonas sp.]
MAANKARNTPPPAPLPTNPGPAASPGNVIAAGCRVIGNMTISGSLRLGGDVLGDVHCAGALTVDAGANIQGRVSASDITVLGKIVGEIVATRRIEVGRGAHIEGSIFAPSMRVEGNACVDGDLLISPERSPAHVERAKNLSILKPAAQALPESTGV